MNIQAPPPRRIIPAPPKMPVEKTFRLWTQEELDRAKLMFDLGASVRQVDVALGRNRTGTAAQRVYPQNKGNKRGKTYRTPPRLWDVFDGMDEDIAKWVLAQVPDGATAVDIVRSIVVDAYHEDRAHG